MIPGGGVIHGLTGAEWTVVRSAGECFKDEARLLRVDLSQPREIPREQHE
jgi:hypothetical protein